MPEIKIYSTLSEKKEPLPERRPLRFFTCGPTVYDDPHIGNARTFMFFDLAVRHLRARGIEVYYLQNITDIDDKIITKAKAEKASWKDISQKYKKIYFSNLKDLGISSVTKYAPATDHIKEIESQISTLLQKGFAYEIPDDGIYYDISKFTDYGKLARRTVEQAEDGISRIDSSDKKRNRGDFCLWKFVDPASGDPYWKSSLGLGRPGWHIEDTAITEHFFGPQYEIHGGGVDIKFPHHEAEIAQQEAASGKKPFVQIWMHVGSLTVGGEKMSKSKGNFVTIPDLLRKYPGDIFRMAVLSHHYRTPFDWTDEVAQQARTNLQEILAFIGKLELVIDKGTGEKDLDPLPFLQKVGQGMDDDFNTPQALASLFELMNETNKDFWSLSPSSARKIRAGIEVVLHNWGFKSSVVRIPWKVRRWAKKRADLRRNKQFIQSDALRTKIESLGYISEDTPLGVFVWPKN